MIIKQTKLFYNSLRNPMKALVRDINGLIQLRAISFKKLENNQYEFSVRLEWPTEITETEFFKRVKEMPKAKTHGFLS